MSIKTKQKVELKDIFNTKKGAKEQVLRLYEIRNKLFLKNLKKMNISDLIILWIDLNREIDGMKKCQ